MWVRGQHVFFSVAVIIASIIPASAGGFYAGRFGNQHGHAASEHVTSIYFNPAGLAFASGTRIYAEGLFALRLSTYRRDASAIDDLGGNTPTDAESANAGEAKLANVLVSPFLGVSSDLGVDNLAVGFGAYVPFGGQSSWNQNSEYEGNQMYPGAVDGTQRWANIEGTQRVIYLTLAGAYKIPAANLSIGAGVNVIRQNVNTVRARTALGTDDLVTQFGNQLEGRSLLDVSSWTWSFSAGLAWQATDALRLGASYQAQPGLGTTSQQGELTNKFGTSAPSVTNVELEHALPDITRLAMIYKLNKKWELRFNVDWQRWSSFDRQCVLNTDIVDRACNINSDGSVNTADGGAGVVVVLPRDWKDTFGVQGGASYFHSDSLEIFGGLLFDTNAVPSATLDPALMDMNKFNAMAGVRWNVIDNLRLTFALNGVYYLARTTDARATDPLSPSRNPDNAGDYSLFLTYATTGVEYTF